MNAFINYLIEANLGLAILLLAYVILLRKETDFNAKRLFLLIGIFASLLFPVLHFQNGNIQSIPSISKIASASWLPEVLITGEKTEQLSYTISINDVWIYLQWAYVIILLIFLTRFLFQLVRLIMTITKSKGYVWNGFQIVESNENKTTFSFFNFIFIGKAQSLSADDKNKIVQHEAVHAKQLHSIDIVLLNVLGIFFWFNPLIKSYKKIFVQLHEFEADARAVENSEVNEYCNLLAKVALQSADYPLANHFNQSLTLKRIEMMRTLKHKIKPWKIISLASVIFFLFFIVACQDQLADIKEIAKNSTNALIVPDNVQARFEQLKKENPNSNYIIVELNKEAQVKLTEMKKQNGLPVSIEFFKPPFGKFYDESNSFIGKSKAGVIFESRETKSEDNQTFAILEYNEMAAQISERSKQEGDIFTVVEEMASPVDGIESIVPFLQQNLNYPKESLKANKEGNVFVQFVINTDGSLSDFIIVKGVDPRLDAEALRVVKLFPNWNPGRQSGKAVRQQFVLPIRFKINDKAYSTISTLKLQEVTNEFRIEFHAIIENGDKNIITGKVKDENGRAMRGANIMNVGSTTGTTTDANGNFKIEVPKTKGQLAVSFVGYETEVITF
jgi:TonB family protein